MDTEFVRTFLAVVAAGNFVNAAQKLHITQSTVSSRIQALERQLGTPLLRRSRSGTGLTSAGQRFLRHAKYLVRTVEQARHDVGLPEGYTGTLTLRARIALWDGLLPQWSEWMRRAVSDVSLRLEIGFEEDIMQGLIQGSIDVGLMYTPENRPGLSIEYLFNEVLQLVTTDESGEWLNERYVHIDWGPEFESQFTTHYPDAEPPALLANVGWLGLEQILHSGGAGYFPLRMTQPLVSEGKIYPVHDSPTFSLPVYLVYSQERRDKTLLTALGGLRDITERLRAE